MGQYHPYTLSKEIYGHFQYENYRPRLSSGVPCWIYRMSKSLVGKTMGCKNNHHPAWWFTKPQPGLPLKGPMLENLAGPLGRT